MNLGIPTVSDLVGIVAGSPTNNAPATYPVGDTTVTWTVTDLAGNTATADQLVTITDTTPPTITAPDPVSVEATAVDTPASAVNLGSPTVDDLVGIAAGSLTNNAPDTYPVGDTTVTWTVTDLAGNTATADQLVTITDTTLPAFNVADGQEFSFEATTPAGADVDLGSLVTATDKGESLPVTCTVNGTNPPVTLPATLPAGEYDVTCTTSDGFTAAIFVTIIVNVQDLGAPVLTVPVSPVTADADPVTGTAIVTYTVSATDAVDTSVDIECDVLSGSVFNVGTTTVTCIATDDGPNLDGEPNSTTESFGVLVSDVTAPTITAAQDPYVVSPGPDVVPPISVDFISNVLVSDAVDDNIDPVCTPASWSGFEWGNTPVTCTATDAAGNTGTVTFDVLVEFPYDINLIVPKGRAEAGSTVKIDWTYLLPGTNVVVDSSTLPVAVSWSRYSGSNCSGEPGEQQGADPGNSDFRYSAADNSWRFNWQTPPVPGSYVVTVSPPGTNDGTSTDSSECVTLK